MVRARKSTGKKVRRSVSKSPRKVKSATKVRKVRVSKKASKRTSKKKVNAWVKHVMKMSKEHNMSYKDALSSKMVKDAYKKGK
jgi:hypothetical protein